MCFITNLLFKAALQVTDQVVGIFKADRNPNEAIGNACGFASLG
jgi:hypothetical protein